MASSGPVADAARAAFRELMDARGHAVDNARAAAAGLEAAFTAGSLQLFQAVFARSAVNDIPWNRAKQQL